ncbi:MAG: polyprenyl synthetase family protein [Proteobacteria bacterium]|nr:polyprenyl synthetase family protein [Pseudomonadota bacterium]
MRAIAEAELRTQTIDICARLKSKIEWWFVHGRYSGTSIDQQFFMVSIFRAEIPDANGRPISAYSALISVLDARTGVQHSSSSVDRAALRAIEEPDTARKIDPFTPSVVLDEFRRFGLPREFECPQTPPLLRSAPFDFQWADLKLASDGEDIQLQFDRPGTGVPLRFNLKARSPKLTIDSARSVGEPEEAMHYVTYPQMSLTGCSAGDEVRGEAWLDHQWGGKAWLQSGESSPQVRGWDWLGCVLDDGSTWVLGSHWNVRTREELARHLTVRDAKGRTRAIPLFEWLPTRWWTSPATRVSHPVAWRLRVSALDADLVFTPFADNQEVRVFTPQRAIWEGAGRLHGTVGGKAVHGFARLESQGRGYVFASSDYLRGWTTLVDEQLLKFLPRTIEREHLQLYSNAKAGIGDTAAHTTMLARPLWDLMDRDGKRWRAVLAYLLLDTLGRDPEPLRDLIFTVPELLHNASLIIDDIQDDSSIRRGHEAIHRRYGLGAAISAANTVYFLPLLKVIDHPVLTKDEKQAILEAYTRQLVRAHLGQSMDLYWSQELSVAHLDAWMAQSFPKKILEMYALKTGAPVEGVAQLASLLSGVDRSTENAAVAFAQAFGLAFQLVDDVNNFSESPAWGKRQGEDLHAGKPTYLIVSALEMLGARDQARLRDILCRRELREDPATLAEGIALVIGSGSRERVRQEARDLVVPAWEALSRQVAASSAKAELRFLWESLLGLSYPNQVPVNS